MKKENLVIANAFRSEVSKTLLSSLLIFAILSLLFSNFAGAETCAIQLGGAGKNSPIFEANTTRDLQNIGGPWDFIRFTNGPCFFVLAPKVENGHAEKGSVYGSGIKKRVRIGAKGAQNKGGWGATALAIVTAKDTSCSITLGDSGVRQTFYGPSDKNNITGWDFVTRTSGPCQFTVFNEKKGKGRHAIFPSGINWRERVGWRVRSLMIQRR